MDRGPERAKLVAVATVAVWITLIVLHRLLRGDPRAPPAADASRQGEPDVPHLMDAAHIPPRAQDTGWLVRAVRLGSLFATQSLLQLMLFFALPFYWQAAAWNPWDPGHGAFLALLTLLCGIALWDPWTAWLFTRPVVSALLPAFGSFVALNAVLPGLGISTQHSLWASSLFAALGVPLAGTAHKRRNAFITIASLVIAAALPGSLLLGGARIVPAAPLKLVRIEIGTARAGKWVRDAVERLDAVPERLICATAIDSPVGLHDRLFHVWRKEGELRARVPLKVVGGRTGGYRTQSHIAHFGAHPSGTYRCTVETATGQVLGSRSVRIATP